ncbi:hypothetical protein DN062_13825 [Nitrincola tibetensis]|uniref:Uncharacterized protein n=1 Tax=Nitrincola tibetensis TaxID=2219697 RepID=A0A364NJJ5_9GAMM|nr:hypothetical protein DN062_13825 [Nitrincola tibetensis]
MTVEVPRKLDFDTAVFIGVDLFALRADHLVMLWSEHFGPACFERWTLDTRSMHADKFVFVAAAFFITAGATRQKWHLHREVCRWRVSGTFVNASM